MKKIFLTLSIIFVLVFLGKSALNPFNGKMFNFHDDTQATRIKEFVINLKNLQIPPRIAPDYSHRMGFPVFNFYAPTPYWITSLIHLVGVDVINSLKLSFMLAIVLSFTFMYKLLRRYFDFFPSLLGGLLYASSPWMAVEIFIRGNLAEVWFLALLPLTLFMIVKNSQSKSPFVFAATVVALSMGLTSHNVLSIVLLPFMAVFMFLNKNRIKNYVALILGFLLSAYFFIPAIAEVGMTQAAAIAKNRFYVEHLLCPWQLWTTPFWGYGGSGPDCTNDGMAFMLGKPQIILGALGLMFLLFRIFSKKKDENKLVYGLMIFTTVVALYLSTTVSTGVSKILEPLLALFQFPWRFSAFSLFGIAFIAGAIKLPKRLLRLEMLLGVLALFVVFYNGKFFTKHLMDNARFNKDYLSDMYMTKMVVYKVAEYLPNTVDYRTWLQYEPKKDIPFKEDPALDDGLFLHSLDGALIKQIDNGPFKKEAQASPGTLIVNVHYMPYWKITVNGEKTIPTNFDQLGRPIINISSPALIAVRYEQTPIEWLGNFITLATIVLLSLIAFNRKLWMKLKGKLLFQR